MLWTLLVAAAAVIGFAAGRALGWWAVLGIPPFAAVIWTQVELEADITQWLAFVVSSAAAAGILSGIGLERIRTRSR
jgi:4-hydroxybenzoate polyprenyltransferase